MSIKSVRIPEDRIAVPHRVRSAVHQNFHAGSSGDIPTAADFENVPTGKGKDINATFVTTFWRRMLTLLPNSKSDFHI